MRASPAVPNDGSVVPLGEKSPDHHDRRRLRFRRRSGRQQLPVGSELHLPDNALRRIEVGRRVGGEDEPVGSKGRIGSAVDAVACDEVPAGGRAADGEPVVRQPLDCQRRAAGDVGAGAGHHDVDQAVVAKRRVGCAVGVDPHEQPLLVGQGDVRGQGHGDLAVGEDRQVVHVRLTRQVNGEVAAAVEPVVAEAVERVRVVVGDNSRDPKGRARAGDEDVAVRLKDYLRDVTGADRLIRGDPADAERLVERPVAFEPQQRLPGADDDLAVGLDGGGAGAGRVAGADVWQYHLAVAIEGEVRRTVGVEAGDDGGVVHRAAGDAGDDQFTVGRERSRGGAGDGGLVEAAGVGDAAGAERRVEVAGAEEGPRLEPLGRTAACAHALPLTCIPHHVLRATVRGNCANPFGVSITVGTGRRLTRLPPRVLRAHYIEASESNMKPR